MDETVHQIHILTILQIFLNVFEHLFKFDENMLLSILLIQSILEIFDQFFLVIDYFLHFGHLKLLFFIFILNINETWLDHRVTLNRFI